MSFFNELKRRNVFRVGIAYVVIAWLTAQVLQLVLESFVTPTWVMKTVLVLLAAGLPIALFLAWAFELTPEGLKTEKDVDRSESITRVTGRKLDFIIIGVMGVAITLLLADKFIWVGEDVPERMTHSKDRRSIAVLPFTNMSADEENEYFADGLSEEILNRLAHIPELHVTGRTSAFNFKDRDEDLRTIGEFLGVAHILEGSVRRQADQVRVTAQLVRAEDGFHLWSKKFEIQLDDVFAVQDEIAESVSAALDVLLNEETRSLMQDAGIRNVDAFVAYQQGLDLFNRAHELVGSRRIDRLAQANGYFDQAIAKAPDFSAAYFLQSDYFAHLAFMQDSGLELQRKSVESVRISLENAERTARDPKRRAMIEFDLALFSDDWTRVRATLEEVARLPGCRSGNWISVLGPLLPTVTEEITAAWLACEPLASVVYYEHARTMMYAGKKDEALAVLDLAVSKLGPSDAVSVHRTRVLTALGRFDEARTQRESIKTRSSRIDALPTLIFAAEGKIEEAKQRAELWAADYPGLRNESSENIPLQIAAATGDRKLANKLASQLDDLPAGVVTLMITISGCLCGAPFDLERTPNLRARIQGAGLSWPPPSPIKYPAKHW